MFKSVRFLNASALVRQISFQSDISLRNLYPNSTLKITTPAVSISSDKFNGFVPVDKLDITYSASSGPGGQNVNKVHTKCDVRFKVAEVTWLPAATKAKMLQEFTHRITKDGYFVIRSDLTRFRHMNLADALEKLRVFIRELETEPKVADLETVERHKRRMEKESARRIMVKRNRSLTKAQRHSL